VRRLTAAAAAGTAVVALRWDDVAAAYASIPPWASAASVALHVVSLILRSEAWRLVLAAIGGQPLPRVALHGANAAAFVAGIAQSQAALAVRVALLSRLERHAIRRAHVALADVPIVAVEIACACVLLAATAIALHAWWIAPVAVTAGGLLLVAARLTHLRVAHRPLAGGLAVLAHTRLRVVLAGLVGLVTLLSGARIWVLMAVTGLPVSFASVALVMLSLGVFGVVYALAVGIVVAAGRARRALGAGAGRLLPSER
jgi:uncharacterized membrane protein YbhN (UPF0104 family)